MRKAIFAALLVFMSASVLRTQQPTHIFVMPMESTDQGLANMVTAKVISHLVKHGLTVVDTEEKADVVLTGAGIIESRQDEYGRTHYHIHGGWRLVSKKDDGIIWADDVASSRFAQSASSSFADNIAKSVEDALDGKQRK